MLNALSVRRYSAYLHAAPRHALSVRRYSAFLHAAPGAACLVYDLKPPGAGQSQYCPAAFRTSSGAGTLVIPPCFWVERLAAQQAKRVGEA